MLSLYKLHRQSPGTLGQGGRRTSARDGPEPARRLHPAGSSADLPNAATFSEMATALDRALAIMPRHAATRILQSTVAYQRLGDTRPLHDMIEAMMAADPKVGPQLAEYWFRLGCWERDVDIMKKAIEVMPPEGMAVDSARFPRAWCEAVAAKDSRRSECRSHQVATSAQ